MLASAFVCSHGCQIANRDVNALQVVCPTTFAKGDAFGNEQVANASTTDRIVEDFLLNANEGHPAITVEVDDEIDTFAIR